jgi:hypothetical protein
MCPKSETLLLLLAVVALAMYPYVENIEGFQQTGAIAWDDLLKQPWFIVIVIAAASLTIYGFAFLGK